MSIKATKDVLAIKGRNGDLMNVSLDDSSDCLRLSLYSSWAFPSPDDLIALGEQAAFFKAHGHFKADPEPLEWVDYDYCSVAGDYLVWGDGGNLQRWWPMHKGLTVTSHTHSRDQAKHACQQHADNQKGS